MSEVNKSKFSRARVKCPGCGKIVDGTRAGEYEYKNPLFCVRFHRKGDGKYEDRGHYQDGACSGSYKWVKADAESNRRAMPPEVKALMDAAEEVIALADETPLGTNLLETLNRLVLITDKLRDALAALAKAKGGKS